MKKKYSKLFHQFDYLTESFIVKTNLVCYFQILQKTKKTIYDHFSIHKKI